MTNHQSLPKSEAKRIALAAQGFGQAGPTGRAFSGRRTNSLESGESGRGNSPSIGLLLDPRAILVCALTSPFAVLPLVGVLLMTGPPWPF